MLPHLADRPLNLQRFPNGAEAPGFWQKDIPETAPKWLTPLARDRRRRPDRPRRQRPPHRGQRRDPCWLGNQASFEIHAWTGRLPEPWQPTFAYIDIDPGDKTTWDETLVLARLYRTALGHLGVRGYPKTTGKRGIQIWIPIVPKYGFERDQRLGRARLDGGRRDRRRSSSHGSGRRPRARAAPGSTTRRTPASRRSSRRMRSGPRSGAPVSAPITWDELDDPALRPDRWTIRTIVERVAERGDLFAAAQTDAQELPEV